MQVDIMQIPNYRVAYLRQIGPYGEKNRKLMQQLKEWAITRDLLVESAVVIGIAHDNPELTPPENCRYDVGIVVSDDYEFEKSINEARLSGGEYAIFSVEHTPEALQKAWGDIFSIWLPNSGYKIDNRQIFERYRGAGIDVTIEPDICEICIPIRRA